ncbi:hypothetical protein PHLCEN_2v1767 [Hermanssonia centrifuga]|nr:hypothetical protein PHLCEN_2v1767 [Hermanssonia centrifuga]
MPRFPDVSAITRLCEMEFTFGTELGILCKFRNVLWPGLLVRELLEQAFAQENGLRELPPSGLFDIEIKSIKEGTTKVKVHPRAIKYVVRKALAQVRNGKDKFKGATGVNEAKSQTPRVFPVPTEILWRARPTDVAAFSNTSPHKRRHISTEIASTSPCNIAVAKACTRVGSLPAAIIDLTAVE